MFFYKVQGVMVTPQDEEMGRRERREIARTICLKADMFNSQNDKNSFYFIADSSDCVVSAGVITDKSSKINTGVKKFLKSIDLQLRDLTITEVTFNTLTSLLSDRIILMMTMLFSNDLISISCMEELVYPMVKASSIFMKGMSCLLLPESTL